MANREGHRAGTLVNICDVPIVKKTVRMFNIAENQRLAGSSHVVLNVFRAFNIIGLSAVCASSWVMIVMSILKGNFAFFDSVSHFFTFCIAVFLIVSELPVFEGYFQRNWPVLSLNHGLSWLGIAMIVMGCQVLANTSEPAFSAETLGLPLWRLILASGILAITFGFFNIISAIIFRDGDLNSRNFRADGSLASAKSVDGYSFRSNSVREEKPSKFKRLTQMTPWGRNHNGRPEISHPIPDMERGYTPQQPHDYDEDRRSPIIPNIERPLTTLHPAHRARATNYSVASMSQF
ncbi:hypothetical protein RB213_014056 [Colletotrichum asianum]